MSEPFESLPLPEHPRLRAWASVLNDAGYWASLLDAEWRYVFVTDELLSSYRDMGAATTPPIGTHFLSAKFRRFIAETLGGASASSEVVRAWFLDVGRHVIADALGLDPAHTTYTPLAELASATDKARRDAGSIAVCEI